MASLNMIGSIEFSWLTKELFSILHQAIFGAFSAYSHHHILSSAHCNVNNVKSCSFLFSLIYRNLLCRKSPNVDSVGIHMELGLFYSLLLGEASIIGS